MSIRVLVADDHAVVRLGIVQLISEESDIDLVGEADSGDATIQLARSTKADVLLLDLNMPGPGGLAVLDQIVREHEHLRVLVLSIHDETQYGLRVLRAGAAGFLPKNSAPEQLVQAIRRVASGRRFVTPALADALVDAMDGHGDQAPHASLSDREFQVMKALAQGQTVSEIADSLALSSKTVSTYRSRVLSKLGVKSNAEIARYALENGLIA